MGRKVFLFALGAILLASAGLFYVLRDDSGIAEGYRTAPAGISVVVQPMTPLREAQKDVALFFPNAPVPDFSSPTILSLSRRRSEIVNKLGSGTPLEGNALYTYPVPNKGIVLVRRAVGEYGAIEIVVGLNRQNEVIGVHIQRHREPPEIASVLTSARFLSGFVGKHVSDHFEIGGDLPSVPTVARKSAAAIAQAVRALLIEYYVATRP